MDSQQSQSVKDTRRVLQVMLGLPQPATDLIMNTVFSTSATKSGRSSTDRVGGTSPMLGSSPGGTPKYSLRRVDSGPLGDFALTPLTCSRSHNVAVDEFKRVQWHMADPTPAATQAALR